MSRIPAFGSAALAGLLPVCAAALGLGEIESKSYLNQPFAAEIPVFSEVQSEITGLSVSLASADTFSQYGLQRPTFLGDLTFAVVPGPRGAVIRVSSTQAVGEPFVTLLLEVRWPQGRLLREYTVLLDPPAFAAGAGQQSMPAQPAAARPAPPPPAAVAPPAAAPVQAESAQPPAEGGAHTVLRNETLWGISDRYRPDRATDINRVMLAIYRANPEAFAGNINRLQAGAVLRMPDRTAVDSLARDDAAAEVRRQNMEWQAGVARATGGAGGTARLELVPPAQQPAPEAAPAASQAEVQKLRAEAEENRRLLALRDAELKNLRDQLSRAEGGEVAVEPKTGLAPAPGEPAAVAPPAATPPPPTQAAQEPAVAKPAKPPKPERPSEPGFLQTIADLALSKWLWIAAAVVLIGALLVARRRSAGEGAPPWRPAAVRARAGAADEAEEAAPRGRRDEDMIVIEEPARATGGFERRAVPRGDDETPLERTISTDSPVNLDQADPLAEADFHMAYGLYDQAGDLLTAALAREPARRDLQLKLLDVYFVWENREGFLKEARALRERVGSDTDPDWKRVVIMGKQLCPSDAMFAGAAGPAAEEMDLALTAGGGGTVDLALGDAGGLDFDLSGQTGELESELPTQVARPWTSARTQEIQTLEAPGIDAASTMETPTIESQTISGYESPTIETPLGERTLETPTVETTARISAGGAEDRAESTAEIDVEDLGLDLTGLDQAAHSMATGIQEALPEEGAAVDFDMSEAARTGEPEESTAEMEKAPTLRNLATAMSKSDAGDTAEQPRTDDSLITPGLSATTGELEALNVDLDLTVSEPSPEDLTATGLRKLRVKGPEDPTMTEVGTKLDLARAYVDMGDPDGARSILNEVLEEGDPSQRQEARQLLDSLDH